MPFLLDFITPEDFRGKELDDYLQQGGYRIGQTVYKFDFTIMNDGIYAVHWLRIGLKNLHFSREARKVLRKNQAYSVIVKPFYISEELEALYAAYKTGVDFESSGSVQEYLHHGSQKNVFDSYVVEVRDGNRLIAAGYFDLGENSLAAILNFYHPDYRQKSLGKFLMLREIMYGQQQHMDWLYPGYVLNNYAKFDYKLFVDEAATELFHRKENAWLPFSWPLPDLKPDFPFIDLEDDIALDDIFKD